MSTATQSPSMAGIGRPTTETPDAIPVETPASKPSLQGILGEVEALEAKQAERDLTAYLQIVARYASGSKVSAEEIHQAIAEVEKTVAEFEQDANHWKDCRKLQELIKTEPQIKAKQAELDHAEQDARNAVNSAASDVAIAERNLESAGLRLKVAESTADTHSNALVDVASSKRELSTRPELRRFITSDVTAAQDHLAALRTARGEAEATMYQQRQDAGRLENERIESHNKLNHFRSLKLPAMSRAEDTKIWEADQHERTTDLESRIRQIEGSNLIETAKQKATEAEKQRDGLDQQITQADQSLSELIQGG